MGTHLGSAKSIGTDTPSLRGKNEDYALAGQFADNHLRATKVIGSW